MLLVTASIQGSWLICSRKRKQGCLIELVNICFDATTRMLESKWAINGTIMQPARNQTTWWYHKLASHRKAFAPIPNLTSTAYLFTKSSSFRLLYEPLISRKSFRLRFEIEMNSLCCVLVRSHGPPSLKPTTNFSLLIYFWLNLSSFLSSSRRYEGHALRARRWRRRVENQGIWSNYPREAENKINERKRGCARLIQLITDQWQHEFQECEAEASSQLAER